MLIPILRYELLSSTSAYARRYASTLMDHEEIRKRCHNMPLRDVTCPDYARAR